MSAVVRKYPIEVVDAFTIDMPQDAEVLCIQLDNGRPCIWARIILENPVKARRFRLFTTGQILEMPADNGGDYVGSVQSESGTRHRNLIFHLFDCGEVADPCT